MHYYFQDAFPQYKQRGYIRRLSYAFPTILRDIQCKTLKHKLINQIRTNYFVNGMSGHGLNAVYINSDL